MILLVLALTAATSTCSGEGDVVTFPNMDCGTAATNESLDGDGDGRASGLMVLEDRGDVTWSVEFRCDNCPSVFNPDQLDTDGDGVGDACEPFYSGADWRGGGGCRCAGRAKGGSWAPLLFGVLVLLSKRRSDQSAPPARSIRSPLVIEKTTETSRPECEA